MATPCETFNISAPSLESELDTAKWKAAGSRTAITLMVNKEELSCEALNPNPCSENRVPPAKKHIPSTNTEPQHVNSGVLCG